MPVAIGSVPHNRKRQLYEAEFENDFSPKPIIILSDKSSKVISDIEHQAFSGTISLGSGSFTVLFESLIEEQSGLQPQYRPNGLMKRISILRSSNALRGSVDQVLMISEMQVWHILFQMILLIVIQ